MLVPDKSRHWCLCSNITGAATLSGRVIGIYMVHLVLVNCSCLKIKHGLRFAHILKYRWEWVWIVARSGQVCATFQKPFNCQRKKILSSFCFQNREIRPRKLVPCDRFYKTGIDCSCNSHRKVFLWFQIEIVWFFA